MSRVEKMKGGEDGGQRKRNAPSPYMRGNAPIIKDTYQIGDTLGKGAFGTVFRGLNIKTGEVVAIKQIEKKLIREDQMPQIMQELELLQNLYHANLVQFIDYKDSAEYLYFILEYVEGGNLHDTMKKFGKFPESLLVIYITQVLRGLEYLHKQGVIHRDIKGANILLTKEGTCKLADFGSCSYAAVLQKEELVGTPFWMAPEIISKEDATTSADIWSLGCTILELLTGMAPYWRLGPDVALYRMVNDDHPPLPAQLSEPLTEFLMGCFIKDEKKRPSASDLMKFQWIRSLWARDDDPPPDDTKGDKKGSPKTVKTGKSRSVILPRIWTNYQNNRSSGSHLMASSPGTVEKSDTTAQELETVWQKIRGDKSKKEAKDSSNNLSGSKDGKDNNNSNSGGGGGGNTNNNNGNKDGNGGKDNSNNTGGGGGGKERARGRTSGSFATLSGNSKLSKEMKQLEEMDLSPQQFLEFLNWWKEWEQGQTKARSAAEAGIDGGKTLGKKKSKLGLKKKGLGTGRSVELILPPDYEYIQRIRKEVAAAAASAAEDKKRKGVAAAAASAAKKKKKATKSKSEPSDMSQTTTSTSTSSSSSSSSSNSSSSRSLEEAESPSGLGAGKKGSRIGRSATDLLSVSSGRSLGGKSGGDKSASGERSKEAEAEAETEETEKKPTTKKRSSSRRENKKENSKRDNKKEIVTVNVTTASSNEAKIDEAEGDEERNAMEESMDCLDEQQRIMQHLEEEDTVTLCRRLLQLNKDNEELREKRTTLEALLVLEREDMADLHKAHTDLQASLVEVATEKQQLRGDMAQLKELAAQSQLEKANLSAELKTMVSALQDSDRSQSQDTAVGWMVPGAKCQAQGKDGLWLDAVILAHQLAEDAEGNKEVSFGVVFIDSSCCGVEESVRASAIRAPREDGWGSTGGGSGGGRGNGGETTRKKSKTLFSWKKNEAN